MLPLSKGPTEPNKIPCSSATTELTKVICQLRIDTSKHGSSTAKVPAVSTLLDNSKVSYAIEGYT